jgi:hypothetical protein
MRLSTAIHSFGTLSLINFSRRHAALAAHHAAPEIAALAPVVTAAADALEVAYAARRPLATLWVEACAAKDAADAALDAAISALSYDLLAPALLAGDRRATAYRALFPEGNTRFIQGPDRAELAHVAGMVAYLSAHPEHPMAPRAADLEAKAAALAAALGSVAATAGALRKAQAEEGARRVQLVRALRWSVALARGFLANERQVDALFPPIAEAKVAEDDGAQAA